MNHTCIALRVISIERMTDEENFKWGPKAGQYISLDRFSGDSPYCVMRPNHADTWRDDADGIKEAREYVGKDPFELVRLTIQVEPIL